MRRRSHTHRRTHTEDHHFFIWTLIIFKFNTDACLNKHSTHNLERRSVYCIDESCIQVLSESNLILFISGMHNGCKIKNDVEYCSQKMSKRHLEPEMESHSMNRKSTLVHSRGIVGDCAEDRLENFSGGRWRRTRMNCSGSSGSGSLKRPRPVTLKPFDFSLIKGKKTAFLASNYDDHFSTKSSFCFLL